MLIRKPTGKSEILKISANEFRTGNNYATLTDGDIMHIIISGPQDVEIALSHLNIHLQLSSRLNRKINYLINLNASGKNSPEARQVWKEITERDDTGKVALVGFHPVARVLAAFVMVVVMKNKIRLFSTEEEGIKWLKEVDIL